MAYEGGMIFILGLFAVYFIFRLLKELKEMIKEK